VSAGDRSEAVRRYLPPTIIALAVWIPASFYRAYELGRRNRLAGPGEHSITPILDAWTQTIQAWMPVALFVWVTVFVVERWLEDRRARP
jgi:hypothetical protein